VGVVGGQDRNGASLASGENPAAIGAKCSANDVGGIVRIALLRGLNTDLFPAVGNPESNTHATAGRHFYLAEDRKLYRGNHGRASVSTALAPKLHLANRRFRRFRNRRRVYSSGRVFVIGVSFILRTAI